MSDRKTLGFYSGYFNGHPDTLEPLDEIVYQDSECKIRHPGQEHLRRFDEAPDG